MPKMMLWKRVTGLVLGQGHLSGGKGKGKVLTLGKFLFQMYSFLSGNRQHLHFKMNMETFCFHFPFTSDDKRELVEIIKKLAR